MEDDQDGAEHGSRVARSYQTFFHVFYLLFCCFCHSYCQWQKHTFRLLRYTSETRTLSSLMPVLCLQTPQQSPLSGPHDHDERNVAEKEGRELVSSSGLRRHAFRLLLPTILLANVQPLDNTLCELRARISYQRETRDCCVICLTETWISAMVPDSAIELTWFSVHCLNRTKELTGKSRGGGICFYINILWRTYTLLNPSAPLIWNFICFCVDHSGYRGNLQRS